MRQIFDFHLHPFIDPAKCINGYGYPGDIEEFVAHLKRNGVTGMAGSVISKNDGTSFEPVKALNDEALKVRDMYPDFYVPGCHVHANFPEESCKELERMAGEGVKLVGELVWYYMAWKEGYGCAAMDCVWQLAAQLGMVVSIHPTDIDDMEAMIAKNPNLKIVMAHPGEKDEYMKKLDLLRKYPNAYLDICGTGLFRYAMLGYGVEEVGSKRFLFGTDFPVCSVPVQVGGVEGELLTEEAKQDIFWNNAAELLGLK